jgi:hypothetical protein
MSVRRYICGVFVIKTEVLLWTICLSYLWEMALNVGLDASFGNMQDRKGIREKARKVNTMKVSVTNPGT